MPCMTLALFMVLQFLQVDRNTCCTAWEVVKHYLHFTQLVSVGKLKLNYILIFSSISQVLNKSKNQARVCPKSPAHRWAFASKAMLTCISRIIYTTCASLPLQSVVARRRSLHSHHPLPHLEGAHPSLPLLQAVLLCDM